MIVSGIVYGQPQRKDNSRRLIKNRSTGKPMIIKSAKALSYVESFIRQVPKPLRVNIDTPIAVTLTMYYQSNRSDLSAELIYDCLQKAGVIKNDRQIVEAHHYKRIDKANPRVCWAVKEIED